MGSNKDANDSIIICLEQKRLFITDALNLTKQIEVQSNQEEFEIDSLLEQRQLKIERMIKCDELIEQNLEKFETAQASHWSELLKGDISKAKDEREQYACRLSKEIKELASKTLKIEGVARENLKIQYEEARKNLSQQRKKAPNNTNMFNV